MAFNHQKPLDTFGFEPHFCDLGKLRMHFVDEGDGEPVLMLHGNPSWSFLYRRLVQDLRDSYRVLVPDHIGCGLSSKPQVGEYPFTLERRVRDLEVLIDTLGIEGPLNLVLHDWGGFIGMSYAVRHPQRVRRIVLFNTAAFLLPEGKSLHWALRFCKSSRVAAFLILRLNAFARVASRVGCRQNPMPREVRKSYLAPYDSSANRTAILQFIRDIPLSPEDRSYAYARRTQDLLEDLEGKPILVCWGERDFVFDRDFLAEWVRRFPTAQVKRFPLAGHYLPEDAWEPLVPLLRGFLASSGHE